MNKKIKLINIMKVAVLITIVAIMVLPSSNVIANISNDYDIKIENSDTEIERTTIHILPDYSWSIRTDEILGYWLESTIVIGNKYFPITERNEIARGCVQFSLNDIPNGAIIDSAELNINFDDISNPSSFLTIYSIDDIDNPPYDNMDLGAVFEDLGAGSYVSDNNIGGNCQVPLTLAAIDDISHMNQDAYDWYAVGFKSQGESNQDDYHILGEYTHLIIEYHVETLPTVEITSGPSGGGNTPDPTFTWVGKIIGVPQPQGVLDFAYRLSGPSPHGWIITQDLFRNFYDLLDGDYTFEIKARLHDPPESWGPITIRQFNVSSDTEPPEVTIWRYPRIQEGEIIDFTDILFIIDAVDDCTPYGLLEYSHQLVGFEEEPTIWSYNIVAEYNGLSEGEYEFHGWARDQQENIGEGTFQFFIDLTPPELVSLEGPDEGETLDVNNVTFNWEFFDLITPVEDLTYHCEWSGPTCGIQDTDLEEITLQNLPDGRYTFSVIAEDAVGHTSVEATKNFIINIPPRTFYLENDGVHFTYLQPIVDAAGWDDTIVLGPGTLYCAGAESWYRVLEINEHKNNLTIIGSGSHLTTIYGRIEVFAENFTIEKVRIRLTNLPDNNHHYQMGVYTSGGEKGTTIQNIVFDGSGYTNPVDLLFIGGDCEFNPKITICNNVFANQNTGIEFIHSNYFESQVSNNIFYNLYWAEIIFDLGDLEYNYNDYYQIGFSHVLDYGFGHDNRDLLDFGIYDPLEIFQNEEDYLLAPDSICIDAGDPSMSCINEPIPNGERINNGAYGNTEWAQFGAVTEPPTITITTGPQDGETLNISRVLFEWIGYDDHTPSEELRYSWTLDGHFGQEETNWDTSTRAVLDDLEDGDYIFNISSMDLAGNIGYSEYRSFTIDTNPPEITITVGPEEGEVVDDNNIAFLWESNEPNCEYSWILIQSEIHTGTSQDTIPWPYWKNDFYIVYFNLADGEYTFQIKAKDAAGNIGNITTRHFIVDTPQDIFHEP